MQACANPGRERRHLTRGLMLVGLGVLFLAVELGQVAWRDLRPYWPVLVALAGVVQLFSAADADDVGRGVFSLCLGGWLYAASQGLWELTYRNSWPVLLVAYGLIKIGTYLALRLTHKE